MRLNSYKLISAVTITALLCSCASTTQIRSTPPGANLFIEGEKLGQTPYSYTDTHIVGSVVHAKMTKSGYEDLNVSFSRSEEADVGAIIGGVLAFVPFLWTMKYKPGHSYEMVSLVTETAPYNSESIPLISEPAPIKKISKKKAKKAQ